MREPNKTGLDYLPLDEDDRRRWAFYRDGRIVFVGTEDQCREKWRILAASENNDSRKKQDKALGRL